MTFAKLALKQKDPFSGDKDILRSASYISSYDNSPRHVAHHYSAKKSRQQSTLRYLSQSVMSKEIHMLGSGRALPTHIVPSALNMALANRLVQEASGRRNESSFLSQAKGLLISKLHD